jgi:hypothetical protein
VTFNRLFSSVVSAIMLSLALAGACSAQSLSDASLAMRSDWSNGYMGLGGNLGQAIERRHRERAKPARAAKVARPEHHRETRRRERVQPASRNARADATIYLIAQSLDHSGLTINTLRLEKNH